MKKNICLWMLALLFLEQTKPDPSGRKGKRAKPGFQVPQNSLLEEGEEIFQSDVIRQDLENKNDPLPRGLLFSQGADWEPEAQKKSRKSMLFKMKTFSIRRMPLREG